MMLTEEGNYILIFRGSDYNVIGSISADNVIAFMKNNPVKGLPQGMIKAVAEKLCNGLSSMPL